LTSYREKTSVSFDAPEYGQASDLRVKNDIVPSLVH
jgi:hypothetical protein